MTWVGSNGGNAQRLLATQKSMLSLTGGRIDDLFLTRYREVIDPKSPAVELFRPQGMQHAYFAQFGWNGANVPGFENVAIMGRQDFYGEGLAERTRDVLEEKGATVGEFILYNKDATTFTAEVNKLAAAEPDAIVLVTFAEIMSR